MTPPEAGQTESARATKSTRGRLLAQAIEAVERFPALEVARDRALEGCIRGASVPELAAIVETDPGLAVATLRAATEMPGPARIASATGAIERIGVPGLERVVRAVPRYDFFDGPQGVVPRPEPVRLHALAVQRACDALGLAARHGDREGLALAALLHDVGRLVMARMHPGYAERFDRRLHTPGERLAGERRELGIDHAMVGGVLARRWGLAPEVAAAIERHHAGDAEGPAALLQAGDMVAAFAAGNPVDPSALTGTAERAEVPEDELRAILYELPQGGPRRRVASGPCPLSARELDVLHRLAEGKVYKQIASDLGLSPSTVRSHLHNVYGKLGALDRAQAVLIATERGWL